MKLGYHQERRLFWSAAEHGSRVVAVIKKLLGIGVLVASSWACAFAPQTGTWVVTGELNGKPGRGIALDVQNDTLVMQVYAYDAQGKATFYMGVGTLAKNAAQVELKQYGGGPYFGGAQRSGHEVGSAGVAKFRFVNGTAGFVQFPGESEKAISRFNFAYAPVPASLKGIWSLTTFGPLGLDAGVEELAVTGPASTSGNGMVANRKGTFACEHIVRGGAAGDVLCLSLDAYGHLSHGYQIRYSVNEGEGLFVNSAGRRVDGQVVSVRRLTTPANIGTGLLLKDEAPVDFSVLRQHFDEWASR